nr:dynein assembly factor 3, axonemal homolog [Leptinotarsa decemlineata]
MFWGLTPALDLLCEYEKSVGNIPEELNILIIGSSDCRHILKTEARKYRHKNVKMNFYVMDSCVELLARQLLLMNIALQSQEILGLEQKTKIFMELYGNSLVRPSVANYLTSAASELIKMVTDYDYLSRMMSSVSLEIRYKERDYLENLLKFWCSKDEFNICDSWDRRLRKFLGARYDSKVGAFDWDLHMRYHNIGGKQVCNQEYRNYRMNGVAFSWLESEVSKPNRSLVCAIHPNGDTFLHHGYLGDMQTGPFVAFGMECEDESFLKSHNGQNTYRATDVTERNLRQIFHELEHKTEYIHEATSNVTLGPVVMKQEKLIVDVKGPDFIPRVSRKCLDIQGKIKFLSISELDSMKYKAKYHNFFDVLYFGSVYLKHFEKELVEKILKKSSLLIIEHQLFVLSYRKKELDEFKKTIEEKVEGLEVDRMAFDSERDPYAKFIVK